MTEEEYSAKMEAEYIAWCQQAEDHALAIVRSDYKVNVSETPNMTKCWHSLLFPDGRSDLPNMAGRLRRAWQEVGAVLFAAGKMFPFNPLPRPADPYTPKCGDETCCNPWHWKRIHPFLTHKRYIGKQAREEMKEGNHGF